jgi:CrcB protein
VSGVQLAVVVAAAGGLGAAARYLTDRLVYAHLGGVLPYGTLLVNLAGSFLLGLLTGLVLHHNLGPFVKAVVGTGFCGGLTTFSTASFETARLTEEKRFVLAALQGAGGLAMSCAAGAVGLGLALL